MSILDKNPGGGRSKTLRQLIDEDLINGTRIMKGEVPDYSTDEILEGIKEYFSLEGMDNTSLSRLTYAQNLNEIDVPALKNLSKLKEIAPDVDITEFNTIAENAASQGDKANYLQSRQSDFKSKQSIFDIEKETATKKQEEQTAAADKTGEVQQLFQDLGLEDLMTDNDVTYFADQLAKGNTTTLGLRSFLMQEPEYQERKAEEERIKIGEEATASRGELETQLGKSSEEFLQKKALPQIERVYARLGGKDRASTAAALAGTTADVAKRREDILAGAGLEQAARAEGYRREDYLGQQIAQYNQALQQWYNMTGIQATQQAQSYQSEQNKLAQIYGTQERQASQDWQEYVANMQRGWQQQDAKTAQKQQMWGSLIGLGGTVGAGAGIGALTGVGAGRGALAGLSGFNYNPYAR